MTATSPFPSDGQNQLALGCMVKAPKLRKTTPAEEMNNYVVVATSGNQGRAWSELPAFDPDGPGPIKAFDPQAWIDLMACCWTSGLASLTLTASRRRTAPFSSPMTTIEKEIRWP